MIYSGRTTYQCHKTVTHFCPSICLYVDLVLCDVSLFFFISLNWARRSAHLSPYSLQNDFALCINWAITAVEIFWVKRRYRVYWHESSGHNVVDFWWLRSNVTSNGAESIRTVYYHHITYLFIRILCVWGLAYIHLCVMLSSFFLLFPSLTGTKLRKLLRDKLYKIHKKITHPHIRYSIDQKIIKWRTVTHKKQ